MRQLSGGRKRRSIRPHADDLVTNESDDGLGKVHGRTVAEQERGTALEHRGKTAGVPRGQPTGDIGRAATIRHGPHPSHPPRTPGVTSGLPNFSTGSCTPAGADLDPAAVAELSDRIGAHHLHVPIAAVELAWVRQDPTIPTYTWRTHTRVDLLELELP